MAKHSYTVATDVPVRIDITVDEMRTLCRILRGTIARRDAHHYFARDLHGTLLESIKQAAESMALEANHLKTHVTEDMVAQLNDAIRRSETVKTNA